MWKTFARWWDRLYEAETPPPSPTASNRPLRHRFVGYHTLRALHANGWETLLLTRRSQIERVVSNLISPLNGTLSYNPNGLILSFPADGVDDDTLDRQSEAVRCALFDVLPPPPEASLPKANFRTQPQEILQKGIRQKEAAPKEAAPKETGRPSFPPALVASAPQKPPLQNSPPSSPVSQAPQAHERKSGLSGFLSDLKRPSPPPPPIRLPPPKPTLAPQASVLPLSQSGVLPLAPETQTEPQPLPAPSPPRIGKVPVVRLLPGMSFDDAWLDLVDDSVEKTAPSSGPSPQQTPESSASSASGSPGLDALWNDLVTEQNGQQSAPPLAAGQAEDKQTAPSTPVKTSTLPIQWKSFASLTSNDGTAIGYRRFWSARNGLVATYLIQPLTIIGKLGFHSAFHLTEAMHSAKASSDLDLSMLERATQPIAEAIRTGKRFIAILPVSKSTLLRHRLRSAYLQRWKEQPEEARNCTRFIVWEADRSTSRAELLEMAAVLRQIGKPPLIRLAPGSIITGRISGTGYSYVFYDLTEPHSKENRLWLMQRFGQITDRFRQSNLRMMIGGMSDVPTVKQVFQAKPDLIETEGLACLDRMPDTPRQLTASDLTAEILQQLPPAATR